MCCCCQENSLNPWSTAENSREDADVNVLVSSQPLRPVQKINLRICMSVDDITFPLTVLYNGKINTEIYLLNK